MMAVDRLPLQPGWEWTDAINADLKEFTAEEQARWKSLFGHLHMVSATPTTAWQSCAETLVNDIGRDRVLASLRKWRPFLETPHDMWYYGQLDYDCWRGLVSLLPLLEDPFTLLQIDASEDREKWSSEEGTKWNALLHHLAGAVSANPTAKWRKEAARMIEAIGNVQVAQALKRWLPGITEMNSRNRELIRGLLWLVPLLEANSQLTRLVTEVIQKAFKKIPHHGPYATVIGTAGAYTLAAIGTEDAVGQLAMLKLKFKYPAARTAIERAFKRATEALGVSRDEIEELGAPSYGLEEVGRRIEQFGEYRAELTVTGSEAEVIWFDGKGKRLKSAPAKVKKDHAEELKELQRSLKDIRAMLPAQRNRIDSMFLQQRSWPFAKWRERYLDHPLIGTIARRLIWNVNGTPALFSDGKAVAVDGSPVECKDDSVIALWHPVGRDVEEVVAWRRRLESLGVTQPFKQAHREVYLLTDAERNTATYSNRFAGHVIRQHQFRALCDARGWEYRLNLAHVDGPGPPTKAIPHSGLRAEFWVEGIYDGRPESIADSGVLLHLATDQVRFCRIEPASKGVGRSVQTADELIPLEDVPLLVFSEIMRDVDLFVGVTSVANDPNWQDGGPEGRYRDYWRECAFGEMSATAKTRKEVLERLVSRLKIADRCSFEERFLVVRGDLRTYKIHLGSGNILMEPNDEYLCIVPDAQARAAQGDLFLPFEGDSMLSVILSKALLLADDTKIKDPTIKRQIGTKKR